jgi:hypothetical protein
MESWGDGGKVGALTGLSVGKGVIGVNVGGLPEAVEGFESASREFPSESDDGIWFLRSLESLFRWEHFEEKPADGEDDNDESDADDNSFALEDLEAWDGDLFQSWEDVDWSDDNIKSPKDRDSSPESVPTLAAFIFETGLKLWVFPRLGTLPSGSYEYEEEQDVEILSFLVGWTTLADFLLFIGVVFVTPEYWTGVAGRGFQYDWESSKSLHYDQGFSTVDSSVVGPLVRWTVFGVLPLGSQCEDKAFNVKLFKKTASVNWLFTCVQGPTNHCYPQSQRMCLFWETIGDGAVWVPEMCGCAIMATRSSKFRLLGRPRRRQRRRHGGLFFSLFRVCFTSS